MTDESFVIEALGIVKAFSGVQALRGIDFRVRRGEIHALLGQNGAGKSTLVKVLNGVHPAGSYDGSIRVNGAEAAFRTPGEARDDADILCDAQVREQADILEYIADAAAKLDGVGESDVLAVDQHAAGVGRVEPVGEAEQGRFA